MGNLSIGFVPTMGALHEGHLSLIRAARSACDRVVVSVFVNPTQFAPDEDFETYPRDVARDRNFLSSEGVDEVWFPDVKEIYPEGLDHVVRLYPPPHLVDVLCGQDRPGHFSGVATVMKRLMECVQPTDLFLGQKDYQQTRVLDWLVRIYFPAIQLHVEPTVREEDGLAMSSRNVLLTPEERVKASLLWKSLVFMNKLFEQGEQRVSVLRTELIRRFLYESDVELLYGEIRDAATLSPLDHVMRPAIAALAVRIGKVRLIDNILIHG